MDSFFLEALLCLFVKHCVLPLENKIHNFTDTLLFNILSVNTLSMHVYCILQINILLANRHTTYVYVLCAYTCAISRPLVNNLIYILNTF